MRGGGGAVVGFMRVKGQVMHVMRWHMSQEDVRVRRDLVPSLQQVQVGWGLLLYIYMHKYHGQRSRVCMSFGGVWTRRWSQIASSDY